jgi:hypothetical protein
VKFVSSKLDVFFTAMLAFKLQRFCPNIPVHGPTGSNRVKNHWPIDPAHPAKLNSMA